MTNYNYSLEQLFTDQEPTYVRPYIAPLITWQYRNKINSPSVEYSVEEHHSDHIAQHSLVITWDIEKLIAHNIYIKDEMHSYALRVGPDCERQSEKAAMCLGFIFASVILRKRIKKINILAAPDLLFDVNPLGQRGIEIAGRGSGGLGALLRVRNSPEKYKSIYDNPIVIEAYLSLWCRRPTVSHWEKIK